MSFRQRFVPSIGNIEKAMGVFDCLGRLVHKNFCNFGKVAYFTYLSVAFHDFMDKKVQN